MVGVVGFAAAGTASARGRSGESGHAGPRATRGSRSSRRRRPTFGIVAGFAIYYSRQTTALNKSNAAAISASNQIESCLHVVAIAHSAAVAPKSVPGCTEARLPRQLGQAVVRPLRQPDGPGGRTTVHVLPGRRGHHRLGRAWSVFPFL